MEPLLFPLELLPEERPVDLPVLRELLLDERPMAEPLLRELLPEERDTLELLLPELLDLELLEEELLFLIVLLFLPDFDVDRLSVSNWPLVGGFTTLRVIPDLLVGGFTTFRGLMFGFFTVEFVTSCELLPTLRSGFCARVVTALFVVLCS